MIDAAEIRPSHDAGSRAILDISQALSEIGFDVEFLWENEADFYDALASTEAKFVFVNRPSLFNRVYARVNKRIKIKGIGPQRLVIPNVRKKCYVVSDLLPAT